MDMTDALASLSALAHDGRLSIFRLLVKTGPDGLAAGDIAQRLGTQPSTMSAQLLVLSNAGLVHARREGRSIIYAADFGRMGALLEFLTKDCCGGRQEICAPLVTSIRAATENVCCLPPRKKRRTCH
jgi:DNA-binding transcriptional ArsR family regulator